MRECILETFALLKQFGINHKTLTSYNAVMPILFYLYHSERYSDIVNSVNKQVDRDTINKWLHKAILLKSFGGSSDGTISQARKVMIDENAESLVAKPFDLSPGTEI